MVGHSIAGMHKHGRSIVSVLARRFRSRAVLDWRTSPSVTNCTFFVAGDEVGHLLWVWLYRIWPRGLKAMVGQAGNGDQVAPSGIPLVLALALEIRAAVSGARAS